jgi:hypothetical protein
MAARRHRRPPIYRRTLSSVIPFHSLGTAITAARRGRRASEIPPDCLPVWGIGRPKKKFSLHPRFVEPSERLEMRALLEILPESTGSRIRPPPFLLIV